MYVCVCVCVKVLRSSAVLGAVVGGCDVASRTLSAAETAKRPVDGKEEGREGGRE